MQCISNARKDVEELGQSQKPSVLEHVHVCALSDIALGKEDIEGGKPSFGLFSPLANKVPRDDCYLYQKETRASLVTCQVGVLGSSLPGVPSSGCWSSQRAAGRDLGAWFYISCSFVVVVTHPHNTVPKFFS